MSARSRQRLHLNRKHARKVADNGSPTVSRIGRRIDLPAARPEVNAALIKRIDSHRVPQHVDVAVALRQALGQWLPLVSAGAAAEDAQFAIRDKVLRVALDGDDVDGL